MGLGKYLRNLPHRWMDEQWQFIIQPCLGIGPKSPYVHLAMDGFSVHNGPWSMDCSEVSLRYYHDRLHGRLHDWPMFGCRGKLWLGLTFNGMSWVALGINKSYYDVGFSQILQPTWKSLRSGGWGTWLDIWVDKENKSISPQASSNCSIIFNIVKLLPH